MSHASTTSDGVAKRYSKGMHPDEWGSSIRTVLSTEITIPNCPDIPVFSFTKGKNWPIFSMNQGNPPEESGADFIYAAILTNPKILRSSKP